MTHTGNNNHILSNKVRTVKLERVILYLWAINSHDYALCLSTHIQRASQRDRGHSQSQVAVRQWYGRHAISNKCRSRSDNKSRALYRLPDKPQRKALLNNFCIKFTWLLTSQWIKNCIHCGSHNRTKREKHTVSYK